LFECFRQYLADGLRKCVVFRCGVRNPPHTLERHALLRPCHQRPRRRRGAEECEERASYHELIHSITSSASASSLAGISSLSAFAVARLKTSSYLVGSSTGKSLGFAPLRMR